jgi:DNA polymerase-4
MAARLFLLADPGAEREPERAAAIAHAVKAAIRDKVGEYVRCSIGIAPNPWLAKVATDLQKPDGMVMILPEQMPEKICTLKLTDLPGIGDGMSARLQRHGVHTVAQLCRLSQEQLSEIWESKLLGNIWWHQLNAYDQPYRPTHRRTVGHSHVLPPEWRTDAGARAVMAKMIHKAAARMRVFIQRRVVGQLPQAHRTTLLPLTSRRSLTPSNVIFQCQRSTW